MTFISRAFLFAATTSTIAVSGWSIGCHASELADVVIEKVQRQHRDELTNGTFRSNQEANRIASRAVRISQPDAGRNVVSSPGNGLSNAVSSNGANSGASSGVNSVVNTTAASTTASAGAVGASPPKAVAASIVVSQTIAAQRQAAVIKNPTAGRTPAKK